MLGDKTIRGIPILGAKCLSVSIVQYADDTTCVVRDLMSLRRLFTVVDIFSKASGSRLNFNKSKGLIFGRWRTSLPAYCPISWTTDPILINGVWVGRGDMALIDWNFRLDKFNKCTDS